MSPFSDAMSGRFDEVTEKDIDIVTVDSLEEGEKEEVQDKIVLTKEQFEELNKKTDATATLSQGLQTLAETLTKQTTSAPAPTPAPNVPELNLDALEQEAFTKGGFASAVQKVAERVIGQAIAPVAMGTVQQQKKLLKLDPSTSELFTKYEKEIDEKVNQLPPQYRVMPDVYEKAYQQVIFEHQQDIINERAQKLAQEAVEKALKEAGIEMPKKEGGGNGRVALYQENSARSAVGYGSTSASGDGKAALKITVDEAEDMRIRGMNPKDPDQVRAYIDNVRARRIKR